MTKASPAPRLAIALLLLGTYAHICCADSGSYYFHLLTQNEGLSESTVTAVVQDNQGFIWLGTQNGLDRYDGYAVRTFHSQSDDTQSLSDDGITALFRDQTGALWIGTKNGLNRYDPGREAFTRFANRDVNPIGVYAIADAGRDALWLNTDAGLMHLDVRTDTMRVLVAWKAGTHVDLKFPLFKDHAGVVWVGTDHGLATIASDGNGLVPFPDPSLMNSIVTALHESVNGVLWIGTATGAIYTLSPDRKQLGADAQVPALAQSPITAIDDSSEGAIWIGTEDHGLLSRSEGSQVWSRITAKPSYPNGLPSDLVTSLYVDRGDRLWIGLHSQGAAVLDSLAVKLHLIGAIRPADAPLSDPTVHATVFDAQGRLWVGTANGLDVFSKDFGRVRYYGLSDRGTHALVGHLVYSLFRDHRGQIWVGLLNAGLCRYREASDDFECYAHRPNDPNSLSDNSVLAIAEDRQGYLWLGTLGGGLDRLEPQTGKFKTYRYDAEHHGSLSANTVYALAPDEAGGLWVGTSAGGLDHYDPVHDAFTRIGGSDAVGRHFRKSVAVELTSAGDHALWMGADEGLFRLDTATGAVRMWTIDDGLPDNFIDTISIDAHGLLWLGTNFGLVRFDPAVGVIDTFQSKDGLPTDEFNHHARASSVDATIYLGTQNGIVGFKPDDLSRSVPPLNVVMTDLLSYGKRVEIEPDARDALLAQSITQTSSLTLPSSQPEVSFDFSALNAPDPARVHYAYRFRGLDDRWTFLEAGHHRVDFKPQAAGQFVFEVRAVAANGTALGEATSLGITVEPAPWQSGLAYAVYTLFSFALVLWLFLRYQQQLALERLQAAQSQENEARLQLALWASGEGTWDVRRPERVMYCHELMQSLGYRDMVQPITGAAFLQMQHPDDRNVQYERYQQQLQSESGVIDIEFRIRNFLGVYVWWKMRGKVVERDTQGNPVRAIGMAKDISADKEKQSQLQLAALFMQNSSDSIAVMNQDYRIIKVNKAFEKMTGYTEAEVLGKFPTFLSASADAETRAKDIREVVSREGHWNVESWIRRRSGENFLGRTQVTAVKDEHGGVSHFVAITADITSQRLYEDELRHLASHDALTNLPNRTLLNDRLSQAVRSDAWGGVVLLSLDNFSRINDSLGHDVGDEVLRETSRRLLKAAGPEDTVARMGGDVFALVVESRRTGGLIEQFVAELLQVLAKPIHYADNTLYPSASAGISLFPRDGNDPIDLIKSAETALFKAKVHNKGAYTWYTPSMGAEAQDYLDMQGALHRAIEDNELSVHYQPKLHIETGEIRGVEALARWRNKDKQWVSPAEFIRVAEMCGLIDRLGAWVLRTACREIKELGSAAPLHLAVNLSPKQAQIPDLGGQVVKILQVEGFPAGRLQMELTETVLMQNPAESIKLLNALRAQDIRLALDDFGTGYSSLGYLRHFPIDEIKVDKSFVQDMDNRFTLAIIKSIVALGRSLDMDVTAEGVEDARQVEILSSLGCTQLQGFFIAKPMDVEALRRFLTTHRTAKVAN